MQVSVWDLKNNDYISHKQVKKDWSIACWSGKWLGKSAKHVYYVDRSNLSEKIILIDLRNMLDMADYVMTQNGIKFDWPKIQARMMLNHIAPPSYFQHIDLYKEFKTVGFTSHSLDYLTDKFCKKYKKLHHTDFPGHTLWDECEKNNPKAWQAMKKYNIHDVLSLEELYENTKEWLPKVQFKLSHPITVCDRCGSKQFTNNGQRGLYWRKICKGCGKHRQENL